MSIFTSIKYTNDPKLKPLYDEIVNKGFSTGEYPLNFFTSQSQRPDILDATWNLIKSLLLSGSLPRSVKEMIMVTISKQNDCRYCEVTHSGALAALGVPQEQIESCAIDPELKQISSPHKEILLFTLKAAADPRSVNDQDFSTLRDLGLSDQEIMEMIMMAALSNFVNTWADACKINLDQEPLA